MTIGAYLLQTHHNNNTLYCCANAFIITEEKKLAELYSAGKYLTNKT